MNLSTNNKIVDAVIILLVSVLYATFSGRPYPEALGFSLAGGLLGMALYYFSAIIPVVRSARTNQSLTRKYAIGSLLFSTIGIPIFMSPATYNKEVEEQKMQIGSAVGRAFGACKIANHIKSRHCPSITVPDEMRSACATQLSQFIPAELLEEASIALNSPKAEQDISNLIAQIDQAMPSGTTQEASKQEVCKKYIDFSISTYAEAITSIKSHSGSNK